MYWAQSLALRAVNSLARVIDMRRSERFPLRMNASSVSEQDGFVEFSISFGLLELENWKVEKRTMQQRRLFDSQLLYMMAFVPILELFTCSLYATTSQFPFSFSFLRTWSTADG